MPRWLHGLIWAHPLAMRQFSGQTTIEREWDTYNPILSATDATLSCNDAGSSLASGQLSATVAGTKRAART